MPEGDTIHTVARALAPRLEGRRLTAFRLASDPTLDLVGRRVERVYARGKHLLVAFDDGRELRSHLGLHGSWHRYRPGEPWKKPERRAAAVLGTEGDVCVCFDTRDVEVWRAGSFRARDAARRLGPDLCGEDPDLDAVVRRARQAADPRAPVCDLLLDQRVAAGIGNVYKSEVLFLERVHPETAVGALDDGALRALYARAAALLRENVGRPRATAPDGGLWVYGRARRPCRRCGAPIRMARSGRDRRSTYWCGACASAAGQ